MKSEANEILFGGGFRVQNKCQKGLINPSLTKEIGLIGFAVVGDRQLD
jgi:hypothetical protein